MLAGQRLALAKGALLRLLERAYQQRAEVALICFAGQRAELRLPPTAARHWNDDWVRPIGGGGDTPLALGIARAGALLADIARRRPAQQRWLWLLSDGRSPEQPERPAAVEFAAVVDFEGNRRGIALGRCRQLAEHWGADYHRADDLIRNCEELK